MRVCKVEMRRGIRVKNTNKIAAIIFLLIFIVTTGILISMGGIDRQSEDNTVLFTATVKNTEIVDTGEHISAEIHTEEYKAGLYLSKSICDGMETEDIEALKAGEKISFRVENTKVAQLDQAEFVNITAMKTETKEILSLDDYNRYMRDAAYPARTAGGVVTMLSLFGALFFGVKSRRAKRLNLKAGT